MTPLNPKIIALLRVSGDKQDVLRQRNDIERLRKTFGATIIRTVELVGVSGTETLNSEEVQRIITELGDPNMDGIGISSLDRLFRPGRHYGQWKILDYFVDAKKCIWTAREGYIDPSTEQGYDICMSAGTRAGAEWRRIRQSSMDQRRDLAELGIIPHGTPKFGWDAIGRKQTGVAREGKWVLNEKEAPIARQMFLWRRSGMATYQVALRLNQEGIRNKRGSRGQAPKEWSRTTVLQVLKSTDYIGKHTFRGIVIPVPRIVDDELFYSVQAMMEESGKRWVGRPSSEYLLRSFLWCGLCGHRCIGSRMGSCKRRKRYYVCSNRDDKPPERRRCNLSGIATTVLENGAWNEIWRMLKNPKLLYEMGREILDAQARPHEAALKTMEREIVRLTQREKNLSRSMKDAASDKEFDELREERLAVRNRLAMLERESRETNKVVSMPAYNVLDAYVRTIMGGHEPETYGERRSILEGLRDLRMVYANGELNITGQVPLPEIQSASDKHTQNCQCGIRLDSAVTRIQRGYCGLRQPGWPDREKAESSERNNRYVQRVCLRGSRDAARTHWDHEIAAAVGSQRGSSELAGRVARIRDSAWRNRDKAKRLRSGPASARLRDGEGRAIDRDHSGTRCSAQICRNRVVETAISGITRLRGDHEPGGITCSSPLTARRSRHTHRGVSGSRGHCRAGKG